MIDFSHNRFPECMFRFICFEAWHVGVDDLQSMFWINISWYIIIYIYIYWGQKFGKLTFIVLCLKNKLRN